MKHFYILIFGFINLFANAQSITGIVVSAATGKPIKAASVFIDNTTIATQTDLNGNFQINIPTNNKNQLVISAFGYEYFLISNPTPRPNLEIRLKTEETILDELVINTNIFKRKEFLKAFRHFFIGNTKNGKRTKILNEKDLVFYFDTNTNQFTAHSNKPIVIQNERLAYTIDFHLELFQVQFNYQTLNSKNYINSNYFGYSLFKENESVTKKIQANRSETYNNSSGAFFNDLITSKLENSNYGLAVNGLGIDIEEYLKIESKDDGYKLCIIKMPTRKPADLSGLIMKHGTVNYSSPKDTTEIEVPFVVYNKETKEQSLLYFQQECILIQKNGHLVNPNDVFFSGFFADLKTADMLPIDYVGMKPPTKKSSETLDKKKMPTYAEFEKEAIAFYTSENFNAHRKARKAFVDKLKIEYDYKVHEPFQLWIEENLKSTLFASKEEAITLHSNFVSTFKLIKDQKEAIESKEEYFSKLYGEEKFNKMYYNKVIHGLLNKLVNTKEEN